MEIEVRVLHSQREVVSSRSPNAAVLPCWFSFGQNKNHRGDANVPRLPRRDNSQASVLQEPPPFFFFFFWPIATASAAHNSHNNNAVMNASVARLSARRLGRCWVWYCRSARALQSAVQTGWWNWVGAGINKLLNMQKKKKAGLNSLFNTVQTGLTRLHKWYG